ncbi:unnamed protein product [Symbiodinium sp. KB8]|nr:unnamed protein product [Symbiodinium sp. KB8]
MSNCWAWGVQQRLASSPCAPLVTQYVSCCRQAGWDARERLDQKFAVPDGGAEALPCEGELTELRRCLPKALLGGKGRPFEACERDFRAVAMLPADDGESEKAHNVLRRGWACLRRAFQQPVDQLVAQTAAVGECRPAVPVKNAAGKGHWTS